MSNTPLMQACQTLNKNLIQQILHSGNAKINAQNENGETALILLGKEYMSSLLPSTLQKILECIDLLMNVPTLNLELVDNNQRSYQRYMQLSDIFEPFKNFYLQNSDQLDELISIQMSSPISIQDGELFLMFENMFEQLPKLENDIVVFRGLKADQVEFENFDEQFVSTSLELNIARNFSGGRCCLLHITIKKGTRVLPICAFGEFVVQENEVVLSPFGNWKIDSVNYSSTPVIYYCTFEN